jgi:transposase-like protein
MLAVRWYLRYGFSYRDAEELPIERGSQVDQTYETLVGPLHENRTLRP